MQDLTGPGGDTGAGPAAGPLSGPQMGRLRQVLSRSPFWVDDNASLRLIATTDQQFQTLTIAWRKAGLDGQVQVNQATLDFGPLTGSQTLDQLLGEGLLYNVTVHLSTVLGTTIATFVQVQIVNGSGATATPLATLIGAYVTNGQFIGWPGTPIHLSTEGPGVIQRRTLNALPLGFDWAFVVPTATRWKPLALFAILTTSVAVANRQALFQIKSAGVVIWQSLLTPAVAASTAVGYALGAGLTEHITFPVAIPWPTDILLGPGDQINSVTVNLQGADAWAPIALNVQEWLDIP